MMEDVMLFEGLKVLDVGKLLGRHVAGGANQLPRQRLVHRRGLVGVDAARNAEIDDLHTALAVDEDVCGL